MWHFGEAAILRTSVQCDCIIMHEHLYYLVSELIANSCSELYMMCVYVLMFTFNKRKYDCKTFQSFLSFATADNTTANNLCWPRKCSQTTGMVRLPYGASRVVGLRWSDVVNSLEREHRSDVAAKEEIGCKCLCIFAATQPSSWTRTTPLNRTSRRAKSAVRFIQPSRNCLSCRWLWL